ncbi:hypothetical protein QQ045_022077 [Rhodiola kirilowii]
MGGAARLLHRLARNSRVLSPSLPLSSPNHSTRTWIPLVPFRANQSNNFNSESISSKDESFSANVSGGGRSSPSAPNWYHPWPEWAKFIYGVRQAGYFERANHSAVDGAIWEFVSADDFSSPEFLRAAKACLEFARDWDNLLGYLSRSDIGVVVENGSAFMFIDAEKLRSRMKSFLGLMDSSTAELDKATLVDLMKFLLSYANIRPASSASVYHSSDQIVVSSVRNLLSELASFSYGAKKLDSPSSMQNCYSDRHGQAPRPQRRQIEMKAGDWICPRCTFMNFARNVKCANCEEGRPRNILTNQWECPQ